MLGDIDSKCKNWWDWGGKWTVLDGIFLSWIDCSMGWSRSRAGQTSVEDLVKKGHLEAVAASNLHWKVSSRMIVLSISHGISSRLELSGFMDKVQFTVLVRAGAGVEFRSASSLILGRGSSLIFGVGCGKRKRARGKTLIPFSLWDWLTSIFDFYFWTPNQRAPIFFFKCKWAKSERSRALGFRLSGYKYGSQHLLTFCQYHL